MSELLMNTSKADAKTGVTVAYLAGCLLVASGCIHMIVWAMEGTPWEGSVSWRKPILFGLSTGATVLSLGWLSGKLRPRFGDAFLMASFSVAMVTEVALITFQQWRGVPSHFNDSTPFDATVLYGIEGLILFATIVIMDLTWRCIRSPLAATSQDMALAIRAGMAFLLFACLLGFVMVFHGYQQIQLGKPPGIFGKSGVMKFPHGMPIHAIQFLPAFAWGMNFLRIRPEKRNILMCFAVVAVALFTAYSLVQTFSGRTRFDLGWPGLLLLTASVLLSFIPVIAIANAAIRIAKTRAFAHESHRQH